MKSTLFRLICRLLIVTLTAMPFQLATAGMIGTDKAAAVEQSGSERAAVLATLSRADVQAQLQARGIDPKAAADRVSAMTDSEVKSLAGQLDSLPAGAKSSNGWVIAAVIIIAVVIWYNWK